MVIVCAIKLIENASMRNARPHNNIYALLISNRELPLMLSGWKQDASRICLLNRQSLAMAFWRNISRLAFSHFEWWLWWMRIEEGWGWHSIHKGNRCNKFWCGSYQISISSIWATVEWCRSELLSVGGNKFESGRLNIPIGARLFRVTETKSIFTYSYFLTVHTLKITNIV